MRKVKVFRIFIKLVKENKFPVLDVSKQIICTKIYAHL